jgi:hypothetical protein
VAVGDGAECTEVLLSVKLEVEDIPPRRGGREHRLQRDLVRPLPRPLPPKEKENKSHHLNTHSTPSAHPSLSPAALDELSADLTSVLHTTLAHASLAPRGGGGGPGLQ